MLVDCIAKLAQHRGQSRTMLGRQRFDGRVWITHRRANHVQSGFFDFVRFQAFWRPRS